MGERNLVAYIAERKREGGERRWPTGVPRYILFCSFFFYFFWKGSRGKPMKLWYGGGAPAPIAKTGNKNDQLEPRV